MVGKKLSVLLSALLCALTVVGCGKEAAVSYESFINPAAAPLTEEQLADCTEWFARIENNGLLRVPYTDAAGAPEQLVPYLEIRLYDVGETDLTDEELALCQIVGHSYDLDVLNMWDRMENVLRLVAENEEVQPMTNLELARYAAGMKLASIAGREIRNGSDMALWFRVDGKVVCIQPGETLSRGRIL